MDHLFQTIFNDVHYQRLDSSLEKLNFILNHKVNYHHLFNVIKNEMIRIKNFTGKNNSKCQNYLKLANRLFSFKELDSKWEKCFSFYEKVR